MNDPISGPVPRDVFKTLVSVPYGKAREVIRKYDPMWGVEEGEKVRWKVTCYYTHVGVAYVEAANQEEADDLANDLLDSDFSFDYGNGDIDIIDVELDVPKPLKTKTARLF
jgi:hypothetical protein